MERTAFLSRSGLAILLFNLTITVGGCSEAELSGPGGVAGPGDGEGGNTPAGGGTSVDDTGEVCAPQAGPGVLRRLTPTQHRAALEVLFGSPEVPGESPLPGNLEADAYSTRASGLLVVDLTAQALANQADKIAAWVTEGHQDVVTSCR